MSSILKKFRGCMIGALLGDCFGGPFEFEKFTSQELQRYFDKLEGPPFKTPKYSYSDDTAMTKCVAESLLQHNGFNAEDMAKKFVTEYYAEPNRGYGANICDVFIKLNNTNLYDVWTPAAEQFNGSGSYGNGGAMRISPVALFGYRNSDKLIDVAEKSTKLTHTHPNGIVGAILQAIAIHLALKSDPDKPLNVSEYIQQLIDEITPVESKHSSLIKAVSFRDQLEKVKKFLNKPDEVSEYQIIEELGNDVSALYSVPTAIYCFLRAQSPIPSIQADNPFRITLQFAISLGGDTDTIASMAGAIAGGYYGIDVIGEQLQCLAEGRDYMDSLASQLYNISSTCYT